MRKCLTVGLLFIAFFTLNLWGASSLKEDQRIPIALEEIVLKESGIFLHVNGDEIKLSAIMEEKGQFYAIQDYNAWICDACNRHTFYPLKKCMWCGARRQ